jgi:hypothetical protein
MEQSGRVLSWESETPARGLSELQYSFSCANHRLEGEVWLVDGFGKGEGRIGIAVECDPRRPCAMVIACCDRK